MAGFFFYPKLTGDLVEAASIRVDPILIDYLNGRDNTVSLGSVKAGTRRYIADAHDIWKPDLDGFMVRTSVRISLPNVLKGARGIVRRSAYFAPCILWSCKTMSTAGVLYPVEQTADDTGIVYSFSHVYMPGEIRGDLVIRVEFYVKRAGEEIAFGEEMLANDEGMLLGSPVGETTLEFDDKSTDFPVGEFEEQGGPLWKIEFGLWDDPRRDRFGEENVQLLLNRAHPDCPMNTERGFSNATVLSEIIAEAYYLIYEKVRRFDDEVWSDTMHNASSLEKGSICQVLYWFSRNSTNVFNWDTPEGLMLSIKEAVDKGFRAAMSDE